MPPVIWAAAGTAAGAAEAAVPAKINALIAANIKVFMPTGFHYCPQITEPDCSQWSFLRSGHRVGGRHVQAARLYIPHNAQPAQNDDGIPVDIELVPSQAVTR